LPIWIELLVGGGPEMARDQMGGVALEWQERRHRDIADSLLHDRAPEMVMTARRRVDRVRDLTLWQRFRPARSRIRYGNCRQQGPCIRVLRVGEHPPKVSNFD